MRRASRILAHLSEGGGQSLQGAQNQAAGMPKREASEGTQAAKKAKSVSAELDYDKENSVLLAANSNQALGLGKFAIDFMAGKLGAGPSVAVLNKVELFHTDSVVCGLSALALRTNAPSVLQREAMQYPLENGATVFGSPVKVHPEKAMVANCSAVREWDSNGTVFGYNERLGHIAGEFGHNDFYPVVVAACQQKGLGGLTALKAMVLVDEIRGRLAEVFALKNYKIDHVVHGAIASAATYGALMGATAEQIESAIGMTVAHYIPFRAIRAGHQLSDSKGASAAISTEVAVLSMKRCMDGFIGPKDIFRNPQAIFRQFEPTNGDSPFNLVLSHSGDDFSLMGMHFKLGLYEHQSAGALQGMLNLVHNNSAILTKDIANINVLCYEPAFGIIGDPAKRNPTSRQSADHSMVFILSRLLKKAIHLAKAGGLPSATGDEAKDVAAMDDMWKKLILVPADYSAEALQDAETRAIMEKITFKHGGKGYDDKYPDGIPTSLVITDVKGEKYDSGFIMYPGGHARNTTVDLNGILQNKFATLGAIAVKDVSAMLSQLSGMAKKSPAEMQNIYNFDIIQHDTVGDY